MKITWNDRPFSPIKEKIFSGGIEWYLHFDGTHSTVQWIDVNGKRTAVGVVAAPTEPLPVDEGAPRK